jgi:hypothetical protein
LNRYNNTIQSYSDRGVKSTKEAALFPSLNRLFTKTGQSGKRLLAKPDIITCYLAEVQGKEATATKKTPGKTAHGPEPFVVVQGDEDEGSPFQTGVNDLTLPHPALPFPLLQIRRGKGRVVGGLEGLGEAGKSTDQRKPSGCAITRHLSLQ